MGSMATAPVLNERLYCSRGLSRSPISEIYFYPLARQRRAPEYEQTRRLLTNRPVLKLRWGESYSKGRLRVSNGLCKDSCLIAKERCSVSLQLNDNPLGSLLSTRSTRWSPQDGGPKAEGCNL